jgi:NADH-quinone oxidoreductase subunit G
MRGDDVYRVTARKDEWGEVIDWICNECRFDKKKASDWEVEGVTNVNRHSVISANKYKGGKKPDETIVRVMDGRKPKLLMDIHEISEVNRPDIELGEIMGPAIGEVFEVDKKNKVNGTD